MTTNLECIEGYIVKGAFKLQRGALEEGDLLLLHGSDALAVWGDEQLGAEILEVDILLLHLLLSLVSLLLVFHVFERVELSPRDKVLTELSRFPCEAFFFHLHLAIIFPVAFRQDERDKGGILGAL